MVRSVDLIVLHGSVDKCPQSCPSAPKQGNTCNHGDDCIEERKSFHGGVDDAGNRKLQSSIFKARARQNAHGMKGFSYFVSPQGNIFGSYRAAREFTYFLHQQGCDDELAALRMFRSFNPGRESVILKKEPEGHLIFDCDAEVFALAPRAEKGASEKDCGHSRAKGKRKSTTGLPAVAPTKRQGHDDLFISPLGPGWKMTECTSPKRHSSWFHHVSPCGKHFYSLISAFKYVSAMKAKKDFRDTGDHKQSYGNSISISELHHGDFCKRSRTVNTSNECMQIEQLQDGPSIAHMKVSEDRRPCLLSKDRNENMGNRHAPQEVVVRKASRTTYMGKAPSPLGEGWNFKQLVDKKGRTRRYYISPSTKRWFTSKPAAKHFMAEVKRRRGNEVLAWSFFKNESYRKSATARTPKVVLEYLRNMIQRRMRSLVCMDEASVDEDVKRP